MRFARDFDVDDVGIALADEGVNDAGRDVQLVVEAGLEQRRYATCMHKVELSKDGRLLGRTSV